MRKFARTNIERDLLPAPSKQQFADVMVKILLLMSDTGGGHRASAEALQDAFDLFYHDTVEVVTVDLWTEHGTFPANQMVPGYRVMMNNPWLWFATYHSVPNKKALRLFTDTLYLLNQQHLREYFLRVKPDVVVSVHPLCNHVPMRILRELVRPAVSEDAGN